MAEEPTIFVTRAELEAMIRQEKEKASSTVACLSLKPPYPASIVVTPYPVWYTTQIL